LRRGPKTGKRLVKIANLFERHAEVVLHFAVVGLELKRVAELRNCAKLISLVGEFNPALVVFRGLILGFRSWIYCAL
ncbi:MAG TPA: hypothetical protein VMT20_27880, partial [Terriglobia bacterium]|nr:hypothetical protein [Terriglobia bacterium]